MPLLFIITYIVICYLMYRKNKTQPQNIPQTMRLLGVVAWTLLFVYIVYYDGMNGVQEELLSLGLYVLVFVYVLIFSIYLLLFRDKIQGTDLKSFFGERGWMETAVSIGYFLVIMGLSLLYFLNLTSYQWAFMSLLLVGALFSSLYLLFERKIFLKK